MSEMVERVARALRDYLVREDGPYQYARADDEFVLTLDGTFDTRELVRAVLAAAREPSGDMVQAARKSGIDLDPEEYWPVMIDEALK